jgi:nucleotide-binding universal stress UspA family protein
MKKVLIALDYNPTAQKVAEAGYALGKALKAEVILLHVLVNPVYYSSTAYAPIMGFGGYISTDMLPMQSLKELKEASEDFLIKARHHLNDVNIVTDVREGDVADEILAAAKHHHADIIVLGSHSQKWLERVIMGSNTEEVLHHTAVPLFIVPTKG